MNRDIFEKSLSSTIPKSALLSMQDIVGSRRSQIFPNPSESYRSPIRSGTTILAFYFKDGLILAGDRQTSGWHSIISQETIKVSKISDFSGFMFAGAVADGQALTSYLIRVNEDFVNKFGLPLSVDGQASRLASFMRSHYNHGVYLEAWAIIAGINFQPIEYKIFLVEPSGCKLVCPYFAAEGSGQEKADSELERSKGRIKTKSLKLKEALRLAVRAIYMAGKKDMGTSDVRLAVPAVATITLKGFQFVGFKEVEEVRNGIIEQERRDGNVS